MDALRNPYTPNAGASPEVIVGRTDQLQAFDLLLARLKRGRTEQSMLITGLRGVGKTVLLGEFRRKALAANWVVIELEVSKHDDDAFRREIVSRVRTALLELAPRTKWNERMRHAAAVLRSFHLTIDPEGSLTAGFDVDPAEGYADHGDMTIDLTDLLIALGEAASDRDRGVALLFDEVQFLDRGQFEALITAVHKIVQRRLPITLVGAGLPQLAELAGDTKSYAERLFTFPTIGNLDPEDAKDALRLPAKQEDADFTDDALDLAVEVTGGYPYFLQELGHAVWPIAEGPLIQRDDIEDAIPLYLEKLDQSFFRVRLDRTTELQSAYLRAMAQLGPGPQRSQDVAQLLGRTSPQIAPTRAELINMGLLYTPEHGFAAFTVPRFDEYMRRAMPELRVPPIRARPPRKK